MDRGNRKPSSEERWRRSDRTRFRVARLLLVHQRNQLKADLEGQVFRRSSEARSEPVRAPSSSFHHRPTRQNGRNGSRRQAAGGPEQRASHAEKRSSANGIRHMAAETGWPDRAWRAASIAGESRRPACRRVARVSVMPPPRRPARKDQGDQPVATSARCRCGPPAQLDPLLQVRSAGRRQC